MLNINKNNGGCNWFLYVAVICLIIVGGCKSKEKIITNSDESLYEFYCSGSEYLPTSDYFRVHEIGESVDQSTSMKRAIQMAQQELAGSIKSTLNGAIKNYISTKGLDYDELMKEQIAAVTDPVGNESVHKVNLICEETIKTMNGLYKTYVVLEISTNEVLNELRKNLSQYNQFQVNIDVSEFKKIFELEMNKKVNTLIN